jgi:phosphoglycerol transferase MdoB-like AlkP superfamily enzyme
MKKLHKLLTADRVQNITLITGILLLSVLVLIIIETIFFAHPGYSFLFLIRDAAVTITNAFVIFSLILIFAAIFPDLIITVLFLVVILVILSVINYFKMKLRALPLLPEDIFLIREVTNLPHVISLWKILLIIVILAAIIVGGIWLHKIAQKKLSKKIKIKFTKKGRAISAISGTIIFGILAVIIAHAPTSHNMEGETSGLLHVEWDQTENYVRNGFLVAFIMQSLGYQIPAPIENYTENNVKKIVDKYRAIAQKTNRAKEQSVNVIFVMNESFSDLHDFSKDYEISGGDVTPNLRSAQKTFSHGNIISGEFGGGTANIEYEALTGFSATFSGNVPYTDKTTQMKNVPSLVHDFAKNGYVSSAFHPYLDTDYRRDIVYPELGFNNFYDISAFQNAQTFGYYVSDAAAYKKVLSQLNSTDKNQFILLVTMQNHMPYTYDFPNKKFHLKTDDPLKSDFDNYFATLHDSDRELGDFIKQLSAQSKPVLLVFWGDHLPYVYEKISNQPTKLTTPILLANFNFAMSHEDFGTFSPNLIGQKVLNKLNMPKTPFNYLLDDVARNDSQITSRLFTISKNSAQVLKDYQLIIYDSLQGKNYAKKYGFYDE